jgi:hypothetical protein
LPRQLTKTSKKLFIGYAFPNNFYLRKSRTRRKHPISRTRVFPSSGTFTWTQTGNIRFAVVKPEGRLFRDHALGDGQRFQLVLDCGDIGQRRQTRLIAEFLNLERGGGPREAEVLLPIHRRMREV